MPIDPADIAICLSNEGNAYGATSPPIVQTSLFTFPTYQKLLDALSSEHTHHVYTRGQNPTVEAVERKLAKLERGEACKCFGSGMAAISAVMMGLLEQGDHVVFVNQTYGPTLQFAGQLARFGVEHDVVLDLSVEAVEQALRTNTKLLWFESPATMTLRVLDLEAMATMAKSRGIATCIDNTWATPLLQKPLTMGIDISVHTASKYLGGHSDLIAGAIVTRAKLMEQIFYRAFLLHGGILGPFDAWILNRGILTLPARLAQQGQDALAVAEFLRNHKAVRYVHHPAFADDQELVRRHLAGYSGLFSFELENDDFANVARIIDRLEHFGIGVSWGGVESLAISPSRGTNDEALARQKIPSGLIRLSIGLEGAELLINDLERALAA
ncbi:MAG: PLP-dependent aspartate aminotransferase family protein [Acidobacteriota bacterium]|nr:MAG: PLP-dependent aspartate aminotransferase family protein [Acidobacteriota bacterium]